MWDGTLTSGTGALATASDRTHSGSYSSKSTWSDSGDDAHAYINFGAETDFNYTFWFNIDVLPVTSKYVSLCMLMMDDGVDDPPAYYNMVAVYVAKSSGSADRWMLAARVAGSFTTQGVSYTDAPTADTWFKVSVIVNCSSADGETDGNYILYINDSPLISVTNVDTDYTYCDFLRCGEDRNTVDVQSNALWMDDVSITVDEEGGAVYSFELEETANINNSLETQKSLYRGLSETITVTSVNGVLKTLTRSFDGSTAITIVLETQKDIAFTLVELLETVTVSSYLETILPAVLLTSEELIGLIIVFFVIALIMGVVALTFALKKR